MGRYKTILFWSVAFCGMFIYLQLTNRYLFHFEEQMQLFLFTKAYTTETIGRIGGFSLYLSRFLTQFYILPFAGTFIISLLLTFTGMVIQLILKQLFPDSRWYVMYILPVIALLAMHLDFNYLLQGTVSYLLMVCVLYLYFRLGETNKRLFVAPFLVLLLYLLAGAVASLFVCMIILWELLNRQKRWYLSLLLGVEIVVIAVLTIRFSYTGEYRMALLPDVYYEPLLQVKKIYMPWIALPVCLLLIWLLRNRKEPSVKADRISFAFQTLIALCLIYMTHLFSHDAVMKYNVEQDYYVRTKQWDKIISTFPAGDYNLQTFNVLNMALAQKGILGENMFGYDQRNSSYLIADWDITVPHAMALSDIYYMLGDVAAAQKLAFEGYIASINGGNVRLLQRLVETNLISGAYPIAEKYIRLLENTLFYRKWAKEQRVFLDNDSAVEQDYVLGNKRKSFCKDGQYAVSAKLDKVLEQLAINNPGNQKAIEYLAIYYLLDRDMENYRRILEKYYTTKVWPKLATCMQEAVIVLEEDDPKYWLQHGVSGKVEQNYWKFDHDMNNKQHLFNFRELMASGYGNTYWYYFMFKR